MDRYMPDSCFGYDLNGIATSGTSDYSGLNNDSNQSLYFASNQTGNDSSGYMQVLQQESEFPQPNAHGVFYHEHDPLTRGACVANMDVTKPPTCVGGEYSGVAAGYTLQQPLGGVQYFQDHLVSSTFNRRHPQHNPYHEISSPAGTSHSLGNNQTILAAARELCYSPFDEQPNESIQQSLGPLRNFTQKEKAHKVAYTNKSKVVPITATTTSLTGSIFKDEFSLKEEKVIPNCRSKDDKDDNTLSTFKISIPSLCLEPLTGKEVQERVIQKTDEVSSRYLPCVAFLVDCQQDLRAGLNQRGNRRVAAAQFFHTLIEPLPERFYKQNKHLMPRVKLQIAHEEIQGLVKDAKKEERAGGCEVMKSTFLGGMRDGESWGLRKWLSKNGGGLRICNDLELILEALRKLPKDMATTKLLAERIGPKAKQAYETLKADVPNAYQAVSNAHPYLPFFHRLESVLKGLHEFDPKEEDVICIDDDSSEEDSMIETEKETMSITKDSCFNFSLKKEADSDSITNNYQRPGSGRSGVDSPILFKQLVEYATKAPGHNESDIEVVLVKNEIAKDTFSDRKIFNSSSVTALENRSSIKMEVLGKVKGEKISKFELPSFSQTPVLDVLRSARAKRAQQLTGSVEKIVDALEAGQDIRPLRAQDCSDFWSNPTSNFIIILRLFQDLIENTASHSFLEPVDLKEYYSLIKHPLSFCDIVTALSNDDETCASSVVNGIRINRKSGVLGCSNLKRWNMFEGSKLIQAVDLVFLNCLAFVGKGPALIRRDVLKLRNSFWEEIRRCALGDRSNIPTKRKETSGFVIRRK